MINQKQFIEPLTFNEIDQVDGGLATLGAVAAVVSIAAALVYAGEVYHDLTCDEHGK